MASTANTSLTKNEHGLFLMGFFVSNIITMFNGFTSKDTDTWFKISTEFKIGNQPEIFILHKESKYKELSFIEIHVKVTANTNDLIPFLRLIRSSTQENIPDISKAGAEIPQIGDLIKLYIFKWEAIKMGGDNSDPIKSLKQKNQNLHSILIMPEQKGNANTGTANSNDTLYFVIRYTTNRTEIDSVNNDANNVDAFTEIEATGANAARPGATGGRNHKTNKVIFKNMTKKQLLEYAKINNVQTIKTSFRKDQIISILKKVKKSTSSI